MHLSHNLFNVGLLHLAGLYKSYNRGMGGQCSFAPEPAVEVSNSAESRPVEGAGEAKRDVQRKVQELLTFQEENMMICFITGMTK